MLATQDVCDLEPPQEDTRTVGERLTDRSRCMSMDQLMFAKDAAEFAATKAYEADGSVSPIDWIRIHCHMTGAQAANYVAAGEHLAALPQTVVIHGGATDLPNLALLCYRHHWNVHEGGWQIVGVETGKFMTVPPTMTFGPPARGPD